MNNSATTRSLSTLHRRSVIMGIMMPLILLLLSTSFFSSAQDLEPIPEVDEDSDGIPDKFEKPGQTYLDMPLYEWGARPNQTDIFVEVDYMDTVREGHEYDSGVVPNARALEAVAFSLRSGRYRDEAPIHIHFDVGDLLGTKEIAGVSNLGGGGKVPFASTIGFRDENSTIRPEKYVIEDYYNLHMEEKRRGIFYYMLFGTMSVGGGAGQALHKGPISLITLGQLEMHPNTLLFRQYYTIAHELGHNFGLLHGGADNINYKPNYRSTMNYLDLYDWVHIQPYGPSQSIHCETGSRHTFGPQNLIGGVVLLSTGIRPTIDEKYIDESTGHTHYGNPKPISSDPSQLNYDFDFNCDGDTTDILTNFDVNGNYEDDGTNKNQEKLVDHDDWNNLFFYFHYTHTTDGDTNSDFGTPAAEISMPPF